MMKSILSIVITLVCLLSFEISKAQDLIDGKVNYDINCNYLVDTEDYGHPVLTVELYIDANQDGIPDPGELSQTDITDAYGNYQFIETASNNYIVKVAEDNYTGLSSLVYPENSVSLARGQDHTVDFFYCGESPLCYALNDQVNSGPDAIMAFNRVNGNLLSIANPIGTNGAESWVLNADGSAFLTVEDPFNSESGTLTSIDPIDGSTTPFPTNLAGGGTANIVIKRANEDKTRSIEANDIDGLALRPDGNLWATVRISSSSRWDVLIKIDGTTGLALTDPDWYAKKEDQKGIELWYSASGTLRRDVDDLALDPVTGILYAVINSGGTSEQLLAKVDTVTGEMTVIDQFTYQGTDLYDIEGFGFTNNGLLYITTGDNTDNPLGERAAAFEVDLATATASNKVSLYQSSSDDYEGCDCLSRGLILDEAASLGDYVWNTNTGDPIPGVSVLLLDENDVQIASAVTNSMGLYLFPNLASGDYKVVIDPANFGPNQPLQGASNSSDPDGLVPNQSEYTLARNENNVAQDFGYAIPLPVEWLSFKVELNPDRQAKLKWKTASEYQNEFFLIERSLDGVMFKPLDKVSGNGTTDEISSYSYIDKTISRISSAIVYYRLVQVDMDGQFDYSHIETITLNNNLDEARIYPNPSNGKFGISTSEAVEKIEIYNTSGILTNSLEDISGNFEDVYIGENPDGIYHIRIIYTNKTSSMHRLVLIR